MSKIGKKLINIPEGVTVEITPDSVDVKGPNASLSVPILHGIKVESKEEQITFTPFNKTKQTRSNWGTMRSLVQNAIDG
jgi:large subunit ribosomal protein L6